MPTDSFLTVTLTYEHVALNNEKYRRQIACTAVQPSQGAEKCVMGNARQTTNNAEVHVHSTRVVSPVKSECMY